MLFTSIMIQFKNNKKCRSNIYYLKEIILINFKRSSVLINIEINAYTLLELTQFLIEVRLTHYMYILISKFIAIL